MAIFAILTGAVLIGGNAVRNSRRSATAKQQLKLIATAIDAYAGFWPKWQIGNVVIADKGWPDFVPGRVFASCPGGLGIYTEIAGFNDTLLMGPGNPTWIDNNILDLYSIATLAYQLLATSGKGSLIQDRAGAQLNNWTEFVPDPARAFYPHFDATCIPGSGTASRKVEVFVDPWGTPMRYFWVYRDASNTAHRGYLPVGLAPVAADLLDNGAFDQDATAGVFVPKTAVGYVLESAGPDKKFGNVWKINPTAAEIADAADNVMMTP